MSKGFKTGALIIVIFLLVVMAYNIFSGGNNATTLISSNDGEQPFYVSLLISWLPMLAVFVFYILFLRVFKQIIKVGERIAVALEARVDSTQAKTE